MSTRHDPAFPAMTLDFLANVLRNADSPRALSRALTDELHELTGARCVVLFKAGDPVNVDSVSPTRRLSWTESENARRIFRYATAIRSPELWRASSGSGPSELLRAEGFDESLAAPLQVGTTRFGALLILGVPDPTHAPSILELIATLAPVVALVMRNASLFDQQEAAIAERTSELRRALEEKERLLHEARLTDRLRAAGTLAAGVAHEINNPLAFITSNLRYALRELKQLRGVDADVLSALQEAHGGTERVREIVRDLGTFARAEGTPAEACDVACALRSSISLTRNELRHRAVLVTELGSVPPVVGDAHRLTQVFVNLLVNAAHAIPEDGADINEVRVRCEGMGDRVVVQISDTGAGIPEAIRDRIFEPFFTTKPVGSGMGLGLSVCHGIVSSLGGQIVVETSLGVGTTFSVHLPVATNAAPARELSIGAEPAEPPPAARVLVIDDDPLVARSFARVLAPPHRVETAHDPRQAVKRLGGGETFDAILCDLMMPVMSGPDVYGAVTSSRPDLAGRFIFVSGGAFTPRCREFLEVTAAPYIQKPFEPRELIATVGRVVAGGGVA